MRRYRVLESGVRIFVRADEHAQGHSGEVWSLSVSPAWCARRAEPSGRAAPPSARLAPPTWPAPRSSATHWSPRAAIHRSAACTESTGSGDCPRVSGSANAVNTDQASSVFHLRNTRPEEVSARSRTTRVFLSRHRLSRPFCRLTSPPTSRASTERPPSTRLFVITAAPATSSDAVSGRCSWPLRGWERGGQRTRNTPDNAM